MSNRWKKTFLLVLIIIIIFKVQLTFASDSNYKVLHDKANIPINKIWKVTFSKSLEEASIQGNIKVVEKNTNSEVQIDTRYNIEEYSISLIPKGKYKYDTEYMIIIDNKIKDVKGQGLLEPIKFNFKTLSNNFSLLKEDYSNPGTTISSLKDFEDALRYALSNFNSEIVLNINNYNKEIYNLEVINDILSKNPIIDYGFKGARGTVRSYETEKSATMTINLEYEYSKDYMEKMKTASQEKSIEILNEIIDPEMTDFEKELAIHDYIVNNSRYDTRLFNGTMPKESYLDYGVLIDGVGVCDSYARAMYRLLNTAGIECIYITGDVYDGYEFVPHAWNIVKIHEKYYHIDATWDDPIPYNGKDILTYDYFNVTDEEISVDHIWDKSKYPECTD